MSEFNSFTNQDTDDKNNLNDEMIKLILFLLTSPKLPEDVKIPEAFLNNPDFQKLYTLLMDLRELSAALSKGDLHKFVTSKGFILANLKALQSNLRHLTWQTKKVASGDFSQRVDFLGEFSNSFNEMTIKLRDSSLQLIELATLDALTQVPNRLALERFLANAFEKAKEQSKAFSILTFDLDNFKSVNDTYGHIAGDRVLIEVSSILNKQIRSSDVFARYGGEEFMAGLFGTGINTAVKIANRALKAVEKSIIKIDKNIEISITVSVGISEIRPEDTSYSDIVIRSDAALYAAKKNGRNQVCTI